MQCGKAACAMETYHGTWWSWVYLGNHPWDLIGNWNWTLCRAARGPELHCPWSPSMGPHSDLIQTSIRPEMKTNGFDRFPRIQTSFRPQWGLDWDLNEAWMMSEWHRGNAKHFLERSHIFWKVVFSKRKCFLESKAWLRSSPALILESISGKCLSDMSLCAM